jgi:catechol 2,3-dioxygenase-like lactoylglutathione lyase family enzyme
MDRKFEVVVIPVSEVDRAKRFYEEGLGFRPDGNGWLIQEVKRRAPGR